MPAVSFANENGGKTAGLCGFSGGTPGRIARVPVVVRINDMQKAEDAPVIIAHMIMQAVHAVLHSGSGRG